MGREHYRTRTFATPLELSVAILGTSELKSHAPVIALAHHNTAALLSGGVRYRHGVYSGALTNTLSAVNSLLIYTNETRIGV